jgi:hypothetical protein
MIPFAFDGEVGSLSKYSVWENVYSLARPTGFLHSASSFAPGTLDGLSLISNSFLTQCPQKPS